MIVATVVSLATMLPIHALGMYAALTKFSNTFNPANIAAQLRYTARMKKNGRY